MQQIHPVYDPIIGESISELISSKSWLTENNYTQEFEQKVCQLLGVKYCSLVTSGTVALMLALKAVGAESVGIPALTMIATKNAAEFIGLDVYCYEVNEEGCLEDFDNLVDTVIYVSLNGRSKSIHKIREKCTRLGVHMIEDACQSFMSRHYGSYLGTIGDIGCFSLSPHKIISTGQGGMVVTNNEKYYEKIERLKDFGRLEAGGDTNIDFGVNFKFTDLQAVVGLSQLEEIHERVAIKRIIYHEYYKRIGDLMLSHDSVPWFVDIYLDDPEDLQNYLLKHEIGSRLMYDTLAYYPMANKLSITGLYLPSSIDLTNHDISKICDVINERRR